MLSEERPAGGGMPEGVLFGRGTVPQGWSLASTPSPAGNRRASTAGRRRIRVSSPGAGTVRQPWRIAANPPLDMSRETTGQLSLVIDYRVDVAPTAPVTLGAAGVAGSDQRDAARVSRRRMADADRAARLLRQGRSRHEQALQSVAITTSGRLTLTISDVRVLSATVPQDQCGAP